MAASTDHRETVASPGNGAAPGGAASASTTGQASRRATPAGLLTILFIAAIGYPAAMGWFGMGERFFELMTTHTMVVSLQALGLGVVAWLIARRSLPAFYTASCAVLAFNMVMMAFIGPAAAQSKAQAAFSDIFAARDQLIWDQSQSLLLGLNGKPNVDAYGEYLNTIEANAQDLTGDDAAIVRAFVHTMRDWYEANRGYQLALQLLHQQGGISPVSLPSRSAVVERMRSVDGLIEANEHLTDRLLHLPTEARTSLLQSGLDEQARQEALNEFLLSIHIADQHSIRAADARALNAMRQSLQLLRDHWSAWRIDNATGEISFDHALIETQYQQLQDEITVAVTEQAALRHQLMLNAQQRRFLYY